MQKCAHRHLLPHHMTYPSTISKHSFLQVTQTPSLSLVFLNLFLLFWIYFCVPHHQIPLFSPPSPRSYMEYRHHHHLSTSLSPSPTSTFVAHQELYALFSSIVFSSYLLLLFQGLLLYTKLVVPASLLCKKSDYPLVQIICKLNTPSGWSRSFVLKN